jgi:hypothetical protein
MKVKELKDILEEMDVDADVYVCYNDDNVLTERNIIGDVISIYKPTKAENKYEVIILNQ